MTSAFYRKLFTALSFVFLLFGKGQAQEKIELVVLDSASNEPVPFAGIVNNTNHLLGTTDLDGKASIKAVIGDRIGIKSTGYKDRYLVVRKEKITVKMPSLDTELGEVEIMAGENPAHRLIRLAVKSRDWHNPQKQVRHSYNAYNKLVFKADEDSLEEEAKRRPATDSGFLETKSFFDRQHLFIAESLTEKYYNPPAESSEKIIANRVSGFQNPLFSILATELQSFGYYKDQIKLLGVSYLNPISPGSTRKYFFRMEDTTYEGSDTIYTISFRPRPSESFKGIKGSLSIHTDGYALKSIKAQPVNSEGFRIFINQLYEKVQGKQWFPVQLNAKIYMPENIQLGGLVLFGDNKGYITNIRMGDEVGKKKTDEIALEIEKTDRDTSITRLEKHNPSELTEKERNTYVTIDSVGQAAELDKRLNRWQQLFSGKIPIGPINIDLDRIYNYNHYEGSRLGLGLSTNYKISRRHSLSVYGAYGFKDKEFKYGSDLNILFYPRKQTRLTIGYRNDVTEAAAPADFFNTNVFLSANNARQLYLRKFDWQEQWQAVMGTRMLRHFHLRSFLNIQHRTPLYEYRFVKDAGEGSAFSPESYYVTEVGGYIRFGFREKFVLADNNLISQGTPFPIITAKYTRSVDDLYRNDFNYERWDMQLEKNFNIRNFGRFTVLAQAGMIRGDVPYGFLSSFTGSMQRWALSVPNSLETMKVNEFTADRFMMVFLSHNFLSNLFYNTKNKPQLELFTNLAWGTLENKRYVQNERIELRAPDKGYYESGVRLHSLIKSSFSRIGICIAYRYGPYYAPEFLDNMVFKLTTGFVID